MENHAQYMYRALELAQKGAPHTAPNPLVGAVIVHNGEIIGEGYHTRYGAPHAEVEAIRSVTDPTVLSQSILYVTLEPCSHYGKTPPCADLIIESKIPHVVYATRDPNPLVSGQGIERLKAHGVRVEEGILESEAWNLNKRFMVSHREKRPYIILKWAETGDGFIAKRDYSSKWISSDASRRLVHEWRSQEMGIMIGTNTAVFDNPSLTARFPGGRNPTRILLDRTQRIPTSFNVFNEVAPTLLYNEIEDYEYGPAHLIKVSFDSLLLQTPRIPGPLKLM